MKTSHYLTPRSLDACHWDARGQALHHFPQRDRENAASVALAIVMGVLLALYLVHWWAS